MKVSRVKILSCLQTDSELTLNVKLDLIADSVALAVAANASVSANSRSTNILQHQALIGHYNAFSDHICELFALNNHKINKNDPFGS